jgi:Multimeric flavodoxin WrbA
VKKITAFIGSQRKKATFQAVKNFEENLKSFGEFEFKYVFLKDYHLEFCKGCNMCFDKGAEFCPLKDDRDLLIEKINNSDGVIIASPNYSFQISAVTKNLLDRMAFNLHRPCYFDKVFIPIVTEGIFGGKAIIKYLATIGGNWGFQVIKGCCITSLEPTTLRQQKKNSKKIKLASKNFYKELMRKKKPKPSLFNLLVFRMARTSRKLILDEEYYDYTYFKEKGWFESDYYYDTSLGIIKRTAGKFFDFLGEQIVKYR